jgi:hypothetical protein
MYVIIKIHVLEKRSFIFAVVGLLFSDKMAGGGARFKGLKITDRATCSFVVGILISNEI